MVRTLSGEIAIVGSASSSRDLHKSLPADVPIWGMNGAYKWMTRAETWFDLHSRQLFDTDLPGRRPPAHAAWLAGFAGPVYLLETQPDIPSSVRYPIEDVVADVGNYFTSTVAYMLGLAIHKRVETIHLYGVDMAYSDEYAEQRACCEYLIGLARGRGHTVHLPEVCPLLRAPLYGRGAENLGGEHITDKQFGQRLVNLQAAKLQLVNEIGRLQDQLMRVDGGLLETEHWMNVTPEGCSQDRYLVPVK